MGINNLVKFSMEKRVKYSQPSEERYDEILQNIFERADKKIQSPMTRFISRLELIKLNLPVKDAIEVIVFIALLVVLPIVFTAGKESPLNSVYNEANNSDKKIIDDKSINESNSSNQRNAQSLNEAPSLGETNVTEITEKEKIKEMTPFKIILPTAGVLGDMKEKTQLLKIHENSFSVPVINAASTIHLVRTVFSNDKQFVAIYQQEKKNNELDELYNTHKNIKIKDKDALIYSTTEGVPGSQIVFDYGKETFTVTGTDMTPEALIKIVESIIK